MRATLAAPGLADASGAATREVARAFSGYQPALDGLRAFAVIAAMLFHAGLLHGGFLGVDLFFVLSGFLITSLLLTEAMRSGTVRIGRFWLRRVRRLAPALLLVLAAVIAWTYLQASPSMAQTTAKQAGWSLAYANNWFALFGHVGYWGANATETPLSHLWSLAVEEQFYLVWPLVLLVIIRVTRSPRAVAAFSALAIAASSGWQWWLADHAGTLRAYLGTGARAESLFFGCLLAGLLLVRRPARRSGGGAVRAGSVRAGSISAERGRTRSLLVVLCVGWLGVSWTVASLDHRALYHGWLVSCGLAATALIGLVVTGPRAWYSRALGLGPLTWIGKRSYSLYLWHLPIWAILTPSFTGSTAGRLWTLRIAVTVFVAAACYRLVEKPIRRSTLSRGLVPMIAAPAALLAAVVVLAPPSLPAELGTAPVRLAGSGGTGSLTVLLAGDSWARNLGYGLAQADIGHRNTYLNLGASGCGIAPGQNEDCAREQARWAQSAATEHPDVAVLLTGTVDQDNGALVHGKRVYPCSDAFDTAYAAALDRTIATLHGTRNVPVYVATVRTNINGHPERSDCVNRMLTAAAHRNDAAVLDLDAQLCPDGTCLSKLDGQPVYNDTMHLGPAGQRWIGKWILGILQHNITARTRADRTLTGPCVGPDPRKPAPIAAYTAHASTQYPDSADHGKLIDGAHGKPIIFDRAWLGWQTETSVITLTLPRAQPICAVSTTWLQELDAAVYPPPAVDVYVSDQADKRGTLLGTSRAPQLSTADQGVTETARTGRPITGRYLTVRVRALTGWSFIDEVTAAGLPAVPAR